MPIFAEKTYQVSKNEYNLESLPSSIEGYKNLTDQERAEISTYLKKHKIALNEQIKECFEQKQRTGSFPSNYPSLRNKLNKVFSCINANFTASFLKLRKDASLNGKMISRMDLYGAGYFAIRENKNDLMKGSKALVSIKKEIKYTKTDLKVMLCMVDLDENGNFDPEKISTIPSDKITTSGSYRKIEKSSISVEETEKPPLFEICAIHQGYDGDLVIHPNNNKVTDIYEDANYDEDNEDNEDSNNPIIYLE